MCPLVKVRHTVPGLILLILSGSLALAAQADGKRSLKVQVLVPADTVLEVDGIRLKTTGTVRRFETPELPFGKDFVYTFKANFQGKTITRKLVVGHERANVLDLREAWEKPAARTEKIPLPPIIRTGSFTLTLSTPIKLKPGQVKRLDVTLHRDHFPQPVRVRVSSAPEGVSAAPVTLASGESTANLLLKADKDTEPGTYEVRIQAKSGTLSREAELRLTIEKPAPPPRLSLKVPAMLELRAGDKKTLPLSIRRENFAGPIRVSFKGQPKDVTIANATIAANQDEANIEVVAAQDAKASQEIEVVADGPGIEAATRFKLIVQPAVAVKPPVSEPAPPSKPAPPSAPVSTPAGLELQVPPRVSLPPGRSRQVEVTVKPKGAATFADTEPDVRLEIPAASKLASEVWSVGSNNEHTSFAKVFVLRAAADAVPGQYTITVHARAGKYETQGTLLVGVEKPGVVTKPVSAPAPPSTPAPDGLELQVPAPFSISPGRTRQVEVTVKPKGERTFADAEPDVSLEIPAGSKLASEVWSVTANNDPTSYTKVFVLRAAADAVPGKYTIAVHARAGKRQGKGRLMVEIPRPKGSQKK
jgi:uncharacterized protein (TIGR03000 family)